MRDADVGVAALRVWVLPGEPASAGVLRRQLQALLVDLPAAQVDDVVLSTSEVFANAVLHGAGPVTVRVWPGRQPLRVEVTDSGGGTPELDTAIDPEGESGRGLFIVDAVATRWGVIPWATGGGKTLFFESDSAPYERAGPSGARAFRS